MNPADDSYRVNAGPTWFGQYVVDGGALNPGAGAVICDTGAMLSGYYNVFYSLSVNPSAIVNNIEIAWRNAANTGYVWVHHYLVPTVGTMTGFLLGVQVAEGERFRVESIVGITGWLGGSIVAVRVA